MKQSPSLSHRQMLAIDRDYRKTARAASLSYVNDSKPGIRRLKKGKGYSYYLDNRKINDRNRLNRIRSLAIPPSWSDVWICPNENGHIQATGKDLNGRKQYRYHPAWHRMRNETKFHKMLEFGKALPAMRKQLKRDLKEPGLTERKVLASILSLMEQTYIRVGNSGYEKLYGSYGLTTLKNRHVKIKNGTEIRFSFKGKKGIEHEISLKDKRLARIVRQCREIPGSELFQYFDEAGERRSVDSGKVNNYIREISGADFTAKDFRTWAGTVQALECFSKLCDKADGTATKEDVVSVLDQVSARLGNSRAVCKKYYVHPGLVELYEQDKLGPLIKNKKPGKSNLESLLLRVLKKCL